MKFQRKGRSVGIKFMTSVNTKSINIDEKGAVQNISLKAVEPIPCDLLIIASEVRPNDKPRGIFVGDFIATSDFKCSY